MNCQRIQSLLSAYLDGELTGEEMIVIRSHMSACEFCSDEFSSLRIVKRLLGTLQSVEANDEWSSTVTTFAYAGNKPWWDKALSADSLFVHFGQPSEAAALTPRGTRMVRALALSAAFVFLAAGPFATHERLDQGVTGKLVASMVGPRISWNSDQPSKIQPVSSLLQPQVDQHDPIWVSTMSEPVQQYGVETASTMPSLIQPNWSSGNALTFVSSNGK